MAQPSPQQAPARVLAQLLTDHPELPPISWTLRPDGMLSGGFVGGADASGVADAYRQVIGGDTVPTVYPGSEGTLRVVHFVYGEWRGVEVSVTAYGDALAADVLRTRRGRERDRLEAAFGTVGIRPSDRILRLIETGRTLIVAAEHADPTAPFPFTVDTFRQPTPDETDPEQQYPYAPGQWLIVDQHVGYSASGIDAMVAAAQAYLVEAGLVEDASERVGVAQ